MESIASESAVRAALLRSPKGPHDQSTPTAHAGARARETEGHTCQYGACCVQLVTCKSGLMCPP